MNKFTQRLATSIILGLVSQSSISAQQNDPADDILQQSRALIEQRDFDKAKLSLDLYQKYVETKPTKWLHAQSELIKIALIENNRAVARNLFKEAEKLISQSKSEKSRECQQVKLLKSQYYRLQNDFQNSNKILVNLLKEYDDAEAETLLLNNKADEALLKSLLFKETTDLKNLEAKVATYERSLLKNPIEVIRLKNKLNILKNPNKNILDEMLKLRDLWIQKDEFALLLIHLNSKLTNEVDALKIWEENKAIIDIRSHPATVAILSNLGEKVHSFNARKSGELLKACQLMIRNANDLAQITEVDVSLLLRVNKIGDASNVVEGFLKNNPEVHNATSLRASVCIALINSNNLQQCEKVFAKVNKSTPMEAGLKSKVNFIEASILQQAGKMKEAAALFLRVGQTSDDSELIVTSLYKAGVAFENIEQYKSAIIAYKQLIEQRRHSLTSTAYHRLYRAQASDKDFKGALQTIDKIIQTSPTPELKEHALYDKGHILMQAGDIQNAIKAFYDFATVYPKDNRSVQMLYEVYKIQRSMNQDLVKAATTLDDIIIKAKEISPDIYARSLHQRALLFQFSGEPRKSITLWEEYLDFTHKLQHPLASEVKIQLAAAYQNSLEPNHSAAASVYADIISKTKNTEYREIAFLNLATLEKNEEVLEKAIIQILNQKQALSDVTVSIIFQWMHTVDFKENAELLSRMIIQLKSLNSNQKPLNNFASAQVHYFDGVLSKDLKKRSEALKMALSKLIGSKEDYLRLTQLRIKIYQALKMDSKVLNEQQNLIYHFQEHMFQDNYAEWQYFYDACFQAVQLLKAQNNFDGISSLRQRLIDSQLPDHDKILQLIDYSLKVTVEKDKK